MNAVDAMMMYAYEVSESELLRAWNSLGRKVCSCRLAECVKVQNI